MCGAVPDPRDELVVTLSGVVVRTPAASYRGVNAVVVSTETRRASL